MFKSDPAVHECTSASPEAFSSKLKASARAQACKISRASQSGGTSLPLILFHDFLDFILTVSDRSVSEWSRSSTVNIGDATPTTLSLVCNSGIVVILRLGAVVFDRARGGEFCPTRDRRALERCRRTSDKVSQCGIWIHANTKLIFFSVRVDGEMKAVERYRRTSDKMPQCGIWVDTNSNKNN